ncbi:TPA: protein-glutamine glutaminase family protein [Elizabethkingia anophelis]
MKKILTFLVWSTCNLYFTQQNHEFSITWAYGLAGGSKPTTTKIEKENAITEKQANDLIKYFLEDSNLDFKCIYNGCQNRAMVMSLLLNKKGIKHHKIWNFDPYKISIFNKQDGLDVEDILKLKRNRIVWDFHVAISVLIKTEGTENLQNMVIDPSFASKPLTVSDWLALQNSPNSYYTYIDPSWYNFVTLQPGTQFTCNGETTDLNIPSCFSYLLTGDFYRYDNSKQKLMAEELATNAMITRVADQIISKINMNDPSRSKIISLISDNFKSFQDLLSGKISLDTTHPFYIHTKNYRSEYQKSIEYWTRELQKMN